MKPVNNICLVLVLYNQKLWECNSYNTIIKHNPDVPLYIYDNSPQAQHSQREFGEGIAYISDPSNSGISHAINQGASFAKINGYEWVLVMDQDTSFASGIMDGYREAIAENPTIKLFAPPMMVKDGLYMSPVRIRCHTAHPTKHIHYGLLSLKKYAPINSGQMINIQALFEVGGYNENVPLDFCEYQFHERLVRKYDQFFVIRAACRQEFSDQVQNAAQKLGRYVIFCQCLKNCEMHGLFDKIAYFYVVFKRAISLAIFARDFKSFSILFKHYL